MFRSTSPRLQKMPKIVFFGTDDFSVPSLQALIDSEFDVVAVVTKPDVPSGRGKKIVPSPVAELAKKHGLPLLQPEKIDSQFVDQLIKVSADAGVLVSYGKILPQEVLDVFPRGIINVHPSLLPKYRGPSPIEAAILNGDAETGVSLMDLDVKMDAGPIYLQHTLRLDQTETRTELYEKLASIGAKMLADNLEGIISGDIKATPQNDDKASYTKLNSKADGLLSKEKLDQPAEKIERMIRAYRAWPGVRLEDNTQIIEARILDGVEISPGEIKIDDGRMLIGTSTDAIEVLRLKPAGKNEMGVGDYLRGKKS